MLGGPVWSQELGLDDPRGSFPTQDNVIPKLPLKAKKKSANFWGLECNRLEKMTPQFKVDREWMPELLTPLLLKEMTCYFFTGSC